MKKLKTNVISLQKNLQLPEKGQTPKDATNEEENNIGHVKEEPQGFQEKMKGYLRQPLG